MRLRAVVALAALAVAGCGTAPPLSSLQLRERAATICTTASRATDAIPSPGLADTARFLARGTAVLGPELAALHALHPSGAAGVVYAGALRSFAAELTAIAGARARLDRGADPIATIDRLQRDLLPSETAARRAWSALGISACLA